MADRGPNRPSKRGQVVRGCRARLPDGAEHDRVEARRSEPGPTSDRVGRPLRRVVDRSDDQGRRAGLRAAAAGNGERGDGEHGGTEPGAGGISFAAACPLQARLKPSVRWHRCRQTPSRASSSSCLPSRGCTCSAVPRGDVLYVGKAKTLRSRVRSYFQAGSSDTRPGIRQMAASVEAIETIVTQTEVEALHLEQNLIKRHRPPYNVRLRDDKSFPYIAVTVEDDFPRVMFTRERHRRGVVYFGPYANAKTVRETLDVLNRVFRYRPCEGPQPGRRSGIPCLDYHIERCHAPCVGYISKEDYRELIEQVIEFLSGDDRPIRRRLDRADAGGGGRRAVRGCRALPQPAAGDRAAVRAAGGRAEVDRDDRRDRRRGLARARGSAGVSAARRPDGRPLRIPPRERCRRGRRRGARAVLPRVLRQLACDPAADPRSARRGRHLGAGRVPGRHGAARASRCACRSAARSGGCRSLRSRTPPWRSSRRRSSPRASARAGSRRSKSCARR